MAYNSANRSERLLQNRRFTTDGLTLSQEAFTSVLDINASEIYTQQNYIPTASAGLPFSGSSQNGLIVSASRVQPGISPDLPILKYWYRKKMKPSADGTQQAYYFTNADPSTPTNTVTSDQLIESDQQTNFISPKYIISANSSFNAEANPPGYKVIVYKSTSATAAGITEAASLDSTYVFDYKTGVLAWVTGNAPASNQYVYITAYQYVGEKLDGRLTALSASIAQVSSSSGQGAGFPFSGSAVITGSLLVTQGITGSLLGTASLAQTASYVTTLNQDLTFNGNLIINGTASINYLNVVYETASVIYSSGSNQFGDAADDTQTLYGSVIIPTGSLTVTGSITSTGGITGSLLGTSSFALNAGLLNNTSSGVFATTGSNVFTAGQTIFGNIVLSGSNRIIYNDKDDTTMLFGFYNGSSIYGPYFQIFGNNYSNASQRGGAEFIYDTRNGGDANFHVSSFDGSTWIQRFRVDNGGAQVTGSLNVTGGITGSLQGTASYAITASYVNTLIQDVTITGSLNVTGGITGSLLGTASYALNANSASYALMSTSASYADFALTASNALTASYVPASAVVGLNLSQIATGSITASVSLGANSFTIVSGSSTFFNITNVGLVSVSNLTVNDNLIVNGTASFINTNNLTVKDKFILINSGSSTLADSGWVSQYNANGSGSAFYLDADSTGTYGRFAVAYDILGSESTVTADEYVVTAKRASGAPPANPTWGGSTNGFGNIYVNNDNGDIYIYS